MSSRLLLFCCLVLSGVYAYGQLSSLHYLPPLTSSYQGNADPLDQHLYISTPNQTPVSFTIIPVGSAPTEHITGQVTSGQPFVHLIASAGYSQMVVDPRETAVVMEDKGYIIQAQAPIYVSVRMNAGGFAQAGAMVSKGLNGLGNRFRIGTFNNQGDAGLDYLNFFSLMATEDETIVDLSSSSQSNLVIQNYGNGQFPIENIQLDRGESFVIALKVTDDNRSVISANRDGLIGALVRSNKPIVVNAGSANGSFGSGRGRDYGMDQIVGDDKIGNEYIFVRGDGQDDYENILIIADQDNTTLWLNGGDLPYNLTPLSAGDYLLIEGNNFINGNLYVRSSQNVFAYQGIGGASEVNQGMFFVPPLRCENRGDIDNIAQIDRIGSLNYSGGLTIVTKQNASVEINNTPIETLNNLTVEGPTSVAGKPEYVTFKVKGLTGDVSVSSTDELYAAYFNINGSASSGGFYSGFPSPPDLSFNFTTAVLGNCISPDGISNVNLTVSNVALFDQFQWYRKNLISEQLIPVSGATSPSFTPTSSGYYVVVGNIECSGVSYTSRTIPINVCPPDFDQDGIIDNIDLDNDNDGILDEIESNGQIEIDFSDPLSPQLSHVNSMVDVQINTAIAGAALNGQGNQITGTTSGFILSELAASSNASNSYTINLDRPLHFKIKQDLDHLRTVNAEESFVWRCLSSDQNISVWDPDHQLLIDVNFDGNYQTLENPFTSTEIRFKFNPNASGSRPYAFYAKNNTGIQFEHIQNNIGLGSNCRVKIEIEHWGIDTDQDGNDDAFDLDSDDDGCFDVVEAGFIAADIDADGRMGESPLGLDLGTIDDRGRFIGHDYGQIPLPSDNGDFLFQLPSPLPLTPSAPRAVSGAICQGDPVSLTFTGNIIGVPLYQWQFYNEVSSLWEDIVTDEHYRDTETNVLRIQNLQPIHEGNYRIQVRSTEYLCPVVADIDIFLTVIPSPVAPPLPPLQVFCNYPDSPKVDQLSILSTDTQNQVQWFLTQEGGVALSDSTVLVDGQVYYAQWVNNLGCESSDRASTTVFIAPLPDVLQTNYIIEQCDEDEINDGISLLNLMEYVPRISSNSSSESIAFFTSADFISTSRISSPSAFQTTPFGQMVYVEIISVYGCVATATIDIQIGASSIDENFMLFYAICEDDPANLQDGLATFEARTMEAIYTQFIASDPKYAQQMLDIQLYPSLEDALVKTHPIDWREDFLTKVPTEQSIWVNVEALSLDRVRCIGLKQIATLYVEPKPLVNAPQTYRACDGESPLDLDFIDGKYPFDTSDVSSRLVNNQVSLTLFYYDEGGMLIGNELPNPFLTSSQTLTVEVEKASQLTTVVNPAGECSDQTFVSFQVDLKPRFNAVVIPPQCDDGEDITDGISAFDTTSLNESLLVTQTLIDQHASNTLITFYYLDLDGNLQQNNRLPNPFITQTQVVTVTLSFRDDPMCISEKRLDFIVNSLPALPLQETFIRCLNLPPEAIGLLEPIATNLGYVWEFSPPGSIERQLLASQESSIFPEQEGTYFITATTLSGSVCSLTKSIVVRESESAQLAESAVHLDDLNQEGGNVLEVMTDDLGIGDYEYALNSGPFQDDPIFEDVPNGLFQLQIRDKNGCGVLSYAGVALGYPKYFSPNGDGINDTWTIEGISSDYNAETEVFIYDRYGRLLRKFKPYYGQWDGTYNGEPMPSTDYWFQGFLADGSQFKGHFSLLRTRN